MFLVISGVLGQAAVALGEEADLSRDQVILRMVQFARAGRIAEAQGILRSDLDPRLMAITLASLSAFPFVMLPIIGDEVGLSLDDDFPARLIEHNQRLLARGIRASTEGSR